DLTSRALPREQSVFLARRVAARADIAASEHEMVLAATARCIHLADYVDEARRIFTGMIESGRRRGVASAVAFACGSRADLESRAGRLAEAAADARESLELLRHHPHWVQPAVVGFLLQVLADRGPPNAGFAALAEHANDVSISRQAAFSAEQLLFG